MSQSEPSPEPEAEAEAGRPRRRGWARLLVLAMAAGLFLLFPGLQRSELEFRTALDAPECVERVELRLFDGEVLARSQAQRVEERSELSFAAKLRNGEYRAVLSLECEDGSRIPVSRQPIIADRDGVIRFKISGAECRCFER